MSFNDSNFDPEIKNSQNDPWFAVDNKESEKPIDFPFKPQYHKDSTAGEKSISLILILGTGYAYDCPWTWMKCDFSKVIGKLRKID